MRTLACCRGRGLGAPFAAAPSSWPGRPRGSVFESVCHGCRWNCGGWQGPLCPSGLSSSSSPGPPRQNEGRQGGPRSGQSRGDDWLVGRITVPQSRGLVSAPPSDFLFLCGRTGKLSQDPPLSSFRLEISVSSGGTGAGPPWGTGCRFSPWHQCPALLRSPLQHRILFPWQLWDSEFQGAAYWRDWGLLKDKHMTTWWQ